MFHHYTYKLGGTALVFSYRCSIVTTIYVGPISVFKVAGGLVSYSQSSQLAHMAVGCVSAVLMSLTACTPLSAGQRRADGHLLISPQLVLL